MTTFDYDYFTDEGHDGSAAFVDHLHDEFELELAPHIEPVVVGAIAAGASFSEWDHDDALEVLGALQTVSGELETAIATQVILCRAFVHSWNDIGQRLGVSRQAAEQRYGPSARFDDESENAAIESAASVIDAKLKLFQAEAQLFRLKNETGAKLPEPLSKNLLGLLDEMVGLSKRRQELAADRMRRRRRAH
jgi:hypothetical protein